MKTIMLILFIAACSTALCEEYKEHIHEGNKLYWDKKYSEAEIQFRKSLEKQRRNNTSTFNLGDALYKQGKYDEAAEKFLDITTQSTDKKMLAKAWHNLGNTYAKKDNWESALNAYKNSLRKDPHDKETLYNYEFARQKLAQKQQQQQKQQGGGKSQDKQDQKGDDKDGQKQENGQDQRKNGGDRNKDGKDEGNKDKKEQGENKDGKNGGENGEPKISKADAERMLNALNNQEKEIMLKVQKQKAKPRNKKEKNW